MAKVTKVTIATVSEGTGAEFDIEHAERILKMRRSGWMLPKDSEYEFKDGTINRRDTKKGK